MGMNEAPLILISASPKARRAQRTNRSVRPWAAYELAVRAAGGMPWVFGCRPDRAAVAEAVSRSDGVLLTGGDDVDPKLYAGRIAPELAATVQGVDRERDQFELLVIEEVFRQGKPLLAICRGQQILNVALGGTLLIDIARQVPGALNHARHDRKDRIVHQVSVQAGSLLAQILGRQRLGVNSTHHQAVARIAKPLQAVAVSRDGIVEGLELAPAERRWAPFLLAVQFHPERLYARHEAHRQLFAHFVRACISGHRRVTV
jgi:putative glutamine amidotransferase